MIYYDSPFHVTMSDEEAEKTLEQIAPAIAQQDDEDSET